MSTNRMGWVDVAKAIGILLVITGHAFMEGDWIHKFCYQFHLPLFAFASGVVFSKKYAENINSIVQTVDKVVPETRRFWYYFSISHIFFLFLWLCIGKQPYSRP